jgi:hypothetical protein
MARLLVGVALLLALAPSIFALGFPGGISRERGSCVPSYTQVWNEAGEPAGCVTAESPRPLRTMPLPRK